MPEYKHFYYRRLTGYKVRYIQLLVLDQCQYFQFVEQPTLTSVAQTVVDKVVRLHHDNFLTKRRNVTTRDDITLIIRNFNFQLRGALTPGAVGPLPGSISPRLPPRPMMPIPLSQVTARQSQVLPWWHI